MIVEELIALLGYDLRNEDDLKRFQKNLDGLTKKAEEVGRTLGTMAKIAGAATAAGFAFLGKSVIDTAAKFEGYKATLTTIEGSAEKAETAMSWVKDFAKTTPYEVDELVRAFVKLRSYGLDPMDGSMTKIGDTAAGMGKSLDQVVEAVADASTFQFERLRELGITVSQEGSKATFQWVENGKTLTKTINKTSADVTKLMYEIWGKKFNGAMLRQAKTWTGVMSNLGDTWTDFQLRIAEAGFFDTVKNKLADFVDILAKWDADGTLDTFAKALSNAFSTVADVIGAVMQQIGHHMTFFAKNWETIKPYLQAFGAALVVLAAYLFPVATFIAAAAFAVDDFLTYLEGGESIIGKFIEWIKTLPDAFNSIAKAVTPENISAAFKSIGDAITNINWAQLGHDVGTWIGDALIAAVSIHAANFKKVFYDLPQFLINIDWSAVGTAWIAATKGWIDGIIGVLHGIGDRIYEAVKSNFNIDLRDEGARLGRQIVEGIVQGIKAAAAAIAAAISGAIPQTVIQSPVVQGAFSTPGTSSGFNPTPENLGAMAGAAVKGTTNNTANTTVNAPVSVTVTQPTSAPGAVGNAIGNAVQKGAQPSRMQTGPAQ